MEFIRHGDDATGLTFTFHFPATEDNNGGNEGSLPSPTTAGFTHEHIHIPLRQNDDDDVEFQRNLEDRQNDDEEILSYKHFAPLLIITAIVLMAIPFILGVYQPAHVKLLPHSSILIKDINPLIMEYVQVEKEHGATPNLMLYGFDQNPPLDVVTSWSEHHKVTLPGDGEKVQWSYFLHRGSVIDITYNVTSSTDYHAYLEITEGASSPNIFLGLYQKRLLGGPINGTGEVRENILESGNYHIGVFNERIDIVEVELKIRISGIVHNTTTAYYKCSVSIGSCLMKIRYADPNSVLLAAGDLNLGDGDEETHVVVTYKPRWLSYLIFMGGVLVVLTGVIAVEFLFLRKPRQTIAEEYIPMEIINHRTTKESQGTLIPEKDSDDRSQNENVADNSRRLCVICFSAPRDCFFLPCGHCVSCYACGRKIVEATGICPICRRPIQMKKIYTV